MIEQQGDAAGVSYAEMMERAGRSFGQMVRKLCPAAQRRTALGLIGGGNNGGDALVALTEMAENGWNVNAYLLRPRGADDSHLNRLIASGGTAARRIGRNFERWMNGYWCGVLNDFVQVVPVRFLPLKPFLEAILAHVRRFVSASLGSCSLIAKRCGIAIGRNHGCGYSGGDYGVTKEAYKQECWLFRH